MEPLLRVDHIHKRFDGVYALQDVSLDVVPGEVHAWMGENGAGKSTLGKIVAGVLAPDGGQLIWEGRPLRIANPVEAQRMGIGMIFQEIDLFPHLTIAENIAIRNLHIEHSPLVGFRQMARQCQPYLNQVELNVSPATPLGDLPIAHMQLVAIARALSLQARLLVMDEPTSSLTDEAVSVLFRVIRRLRDRGVSIVYVSHKMEEIFEIADRVSVLRDGRFVGSRPTSDLTKDELITMMVGREFADDQRVPSHRTNQRLLSARGLTTRKLKGLDFDLYAGEVLGVAGLVGSGRSELGEALFGLDRLTSGELTVKGTAYHPASPRSAMRNGIGLLPEDRKLQGLMMGMRVSENISMASLNRVSFGGWIRPDQEDDVVGASMERTAIKAATPHATMHTLSGGNQQKVLLGRWLHVDPDILFLDDPTRGIDIGAKHDIYRIIEEQAQAGKGVLLVSSELPELLRCCDRIMVLSNGRLMGTVDARTATQESVMRLAFQTAGTSSNA